MTMWIEEKMKKEANRKKINKEINGEKIKWKKKEINRWNER